MRKISGLSMVCLMALSLCVWTSCGKDPDDETKDGQIITEGFVDLGLPSGTKWKATNEGEVFYTFKEATNKFGKKLPDTIQYNELIRECKWEWVDGKGFKITGSNGKAIMMPAAGFRSCDSDDDLSVGAEGFYWTSKTLGPDRAFRVGFNKNYGANIHYITNCYHGSVRLVE